MSLQILTAADLNVVHVTQIPMIKNKIPRHKNKMLRLRVNSGPTDDTLRQWGHLASAFCNVLNLTNNQKTIKKNVNWKTVLNNDYINLLRMYLSNDHM